MAELLVQAKKHWIDNLSQSETNALPEYVKKTKNSRIQIGDIVVVKSDGWSWGKEERLPHYIVIKLPGISLESIQHLTDSLDSSVDLDKKSRTLKKRKWKIPKGWMDQHLNQDVHEISILNDRVNFLNSITEKTE